MRGLGPRRCQTSFLGCFSQGTLSSTNPTPLPEDGRPSDQVGARALWGERLWAQTPSHSAGLSLSPLSMKVKLRPELNHCGDVSLWPQHGGGGEHSSAWEKEDPGGLRILADDLLLCTYVKREIKLCQSHWGPVFPNILLTAGT